MDAITFYFSFRSPYAWLAYHRLGRALDGVAVRVERVPVFPPPDFPNDPAANPQKLKYLFTDVERIATAYGLTVRWPADADTDWMRPHAAYLHAADAGRGDPFAMALYAARFSRGEDVARDDVIARAADSAGVDGAATVRAAGDPAFHERVFTGMGRALQDGIFGVPYFVYGDQVFWGNDRLEWLVRAIRTRAGQPVPDLRGDLLARPC
jgi:2-hydroxychromene-2-carboxylate isomerase